MIDKYKTLSLLLVLAACNGGGGPVPFEDYCDQYSAVLCEAADKCDCLDGYSIDLCRTFIGADCRDEVEDPVNRGVMTYDAGQAGQCLVALQRILRDCSLDFDDYPDACDRFLSGTLPAGRPCDSDSECLSGLECYDDLCADMPGENQPCLSGDGCDSELDLYCGLDDICRRYKGAGQDCSTESWSCADDLYCDSRSDTCRPYLGQGESCEHDRYACGDDLYCSTASQVCRPYPSSGESCADSHEDCADDLYCDSDLICRPQKDAGAPCADDDECKSYDCIDGFCEQDEERECPFL
ncbi:MAG: hypothetical protein ABIJ56_22405 [Pseudomonadota bacterium]